MEDLLISAGLTRLQAQAYLYLVKHGPSLPSKLTPVLGSTRTNTYKVLEVLEEQGLVLRETKDGKSTFVAEDPITLTTILAEKRNRIIALEKTIGEAVQQLRKSFVKAQRNTKVQLGTGKEAIIKGYRNQAEQRYPIYFVKSREDVPFMSFDTMHDIRFMQGKLAPARHGITHDSIDQPTSDSGLDTRTKLVRTWIDEKDYTAPVEWSVSGNRLVIHVFEGAGRTVAIQDEYIAEAFRQLWQLLDKSIRTPTAYQAMPVKARRNV